MSSRTPATPAGLSVLTLQTVGVQQLLAFLVHFDAALRAAHALPGDAPQEALALVAVGGRRGRPHLEVVGRGAGDGVDQGLQALLVHVVLLLDVNTGRNNKDEGEMGLCPTEQFHKSNCWLLL